MIKQRHHLHFPRPFLKQVLLVGIGVSGLLVTVALYIVVVLTHPKRKIAHDLYIAAISPRPALIIHGQGESVVDPRDAQRLYVAAQEPKEPWLLPNADHCGAYLANRQAYVAKIDAFFRRSLARAPQRNAA
jgi:fermentation-respiration switch protein FrsA (DUF1100 family)